MKIKVFRENRFNKDLEEKKDCIWCIYNNDVIVVNSCYSRFGFWMLCVF